MVDAFSSFFAVFAAYSRCWDIDNMFGAFFGGVIMIYLVVVLFCYLVRSFR